MLLSLDSGVSALSHLQDSLSNTANNIANVQTTGFKSESMTFADTFSQTIGGGSSGAMQIGTGMTTASLRTSFKQGALSSTGNPNDLAIDGDNGFFLVTNPSTLATFATRDGSFGNNGGFLTTTDGFHVQGYTSVPGTTVGDIKIDNTGATKIDSTGATVPDTSDVEKYSISSDGTLTVKLVSGTEFKRAQLVLQSFASPQQLQKAGGNLYTNLANASPSTPVPPGTGGTGVLRPGELEMSNVDLAKELTTLITTQRAYEANSKVITTSDQVLQTMVNLVR